MKWIATLALIAGTFANGATPIELGNKRELFLDNHFIETLKGLHRVQHEPVDRGPVFAFDQPWEGAFSGYVTILHHDQTYYAYYRGKPEALPDGEGEVTCVAISKDGIRWEKPKLGVYEYQGIRDTNIIAVDPRVIHNFSPLIDSNPSVAPQHRFKALGSRNPKEGLTAFVSADGLHWSPLKEDPVITEAQVKEAFPFSSYMFDSQNVAFYSESEKCYVTYFRVYKRVGGNGENIRRIARATSSDFIHWGQFELMEYRDLDGKLLPDNEQLYTNQTHSYFRAPHIYISTAARIFFNRRAITDEQAKEIGVHPNYAKDTSDAVLMSTRGGNFYDRVTLSSFLRPGIGAKNWISRTNYPALNIVPTGPTEMSLYTNQDYAQPSAHLRRYSLRFDGFVSLRAPYEGGELLSKPFTFDGRFLKLNFATSAGGCIQIEILDERGKPIPGYTMEDAKMLIGNEVERTFEWRQGKDLSSLTGKVVRLKILMRDADLFSLRFSREP